MGRSFQEIRSQVCGACRRASRWICDVQDCICRKWNAAEMGPKRDIIGELAKAVRKNGLIFGLSSHRIEHWWFMNGGRKFDSDVKDPEICGFLWTRERGK